MKKSILIVDDMEMNRNLLSELLKDSYTIYQAANGYEALEIMREHHKEIILILLDLMMPKLSGFKVMEKLQKESWYNSFAIIVISGADEEMNEVQCFELGALDFIRKPFNAAIVKKRVQNACELMIYKKNLENKVKLQTKSIRKYARKLNKMNEEIILILGSVVESGDMESGEHIFRVKGYTGILAEEMMHRYPEYNLTPKQVQLIISASALHDIGKIAIPDSILLKPGKLTPEEYEIMKGHSRKGFELLQKVASVWDDDYMKVCGEIACYHHERYDGKGYPDGLKGEEIPISAQIVSVADAYDALINKRRYKKTFSKDEAYNMIISGECGSFSLKLMECFKATKDKFEKMADVQRKK